MTDHDTAAVLTEADLVWECGPHTNAWKGHDARCRQVPRLAAQPPQDDPQPDEREWACAKCGQGTAEHATPTSDCVYEPVLRRPTDPNAGLREGVEQAVEDVLGRTGDQRLRQAMAHVRAALAEPTPGSESP